MPNLDLEIPDKKNKSLRYRLFEIFPGATSYLILISLGLMAYFYPAVYSYIIVFYILSWVLRSFGLIAKTFIAYRMVNKLKLESWSQVLENGDYQPKSRIASKYIDRLLENRKRIKSSDDLLSSKDVRQAIVIPVYDESYSLVSRNLEAMVHSDYDIKNKVAIFITYEARTGARVEKDMLRVQQAYNNLFQTVKLNKHELSAGEIPGKGANISSCASLITEYYESKGVKASNVIVTTIDADNVMADNYLSLSEFNYACATNRERASYQPVAMYTNNIWHVPAVARMQAINNTIWSVSQSIRPRLVRNFASHGQGLASLIKTDFWSKKTIVEDGHQYWRSLLALEGDYRVIPFYSVINQDAVVADSYMGIFKAQFYQLRRWAYGASDIAYVADKVIPQVKRNNPKRLYFVLTKFIRLVDTHITWATNAFIILLAPMLPTIFSAYGRYDSLSSRLPQIISRMQTVALIALVMVLIFNLIILPKKPAKTSNVKYVFIVLQWIISPVVGIIYGSGSSLYSQTRLMLGKYYEAFDVTTKG